MSGYFMGWSANPAPVHPCQRCGGETYVVSHEARECGSCGAYSRREHVEVWRPNPLDIPRWQAELAAKKAQQGLAAPVVESLQVGQRILVTYENGYQRVLDVAYLSPARYENLWWTLEVAVTGVGAGGRKGQGSLYVRKSDRRVELRYGKDSEILNAVEVVDPAYAKARKKAPPTDAIRLGTKRSAAIFGGIVSGSVYHFDDQYGTSPDRGLDVFWARESLEKQAMSRGVKSIRKRGPGQFHLAFHSNSWVDFTSRGDGDLPEAGHERFRGLELDEPTAMATTTMGAERFRGLELDEPAPYEVAPEVGGRWGGLELDEPAPVPVTEPWEPEVYVTPAGYAPPPPPMPATEAWEPEVWQAPPGYAAPLPPEIVMASPAPGPVMIGRPDYQERVERRRERLEGAAEHHAREASSHFRRADLREEASGIPFGQPILVGHHSEGRHRRAIAKADAAMRRSIEASEAAGSYAAAAESVGRGGISSDDPEALIKLRQQVAAIDHEVARGKAANAILAKAAKALGLKGAVRRLTEAGYGKPEGQRERAQAILAKAGELGLTQSEAVVLARSYASQSYHGLGLPAYHFTNLGANRRRYLQRIESMEEEGKKRGAVMFAAAPAEGFDRGPGFYVVETETGGDVGEGPWGTAEDAQSFLDSEVGVVAHVVQVGAPVTATAAVESQVGDVRIVENFELNRIQLFTPGKPGPSTRAKLKGRGFRWAPSEGAWQRHLNDAGRAAARMIAREIAEAGGHLKNPRKRKAKRRR